MVNIRILATVMTVSILGLSAAYAASTAGGLDTPSTSTPQIFAVGGQQIGSWDQTQLSVTGAITATGAVTAPAHYYSSDARLKTDVHPIKGALDRLLEIRGVEFKWKEDGRADMGVVAQNVAEVFPTLVAQDSKGMMSVEYGNLVGPMIEAIRTLKVQNDGLEAQVKEIAASLQTLKQENAKLRSSVRYEESSSKPAPTAAP
jgi:hypothetical protein